ncbi:condensin complex subunit 3 [Pancytospora epiphaga]|nr:condensin complex subunit 3 [Pancytospora epiphaga]
MRSAVVEREFDAKSIFLRIVKMLGVAEFSDYFYCEDRVFTDVIEDYLKFNGEELHLTRFTPGYVWMMGVYYRLREENVGRDNLNMMDLEEFLDIIAERCTALENNDKKTEDVKTLIGLFRLLSFYDLFDEQSRKKVLKIVNKLLTKCNVKDVVDEVIVLCKRICHTDITPFLGSIVKKLRGTPLCYTVSGCIMKHLPYGELHEAIFQEIAIPNLNESLEIIYWYFFHCPSENLKELLLSFLPNTRAIHYSIDLVLTGHVEVDAILPTIESLLFKFDEAVAIPATKLLLSQKMKGAEYFKYLLQIFYLTENESIQQYLTVFFYEYFAHDAFPLIDVFCDVIQLITDNYRIFADQAFFWISNSETQNGLQWLFLRICGCILRNNEELKNRRYFFFILDRIPIISTWEPVLTKKIIYLFGQIIKTKPREQTQSILASLLEIDDGIPLGAEEYILLRNELGTIPCMQ